ncbi:MAG: ABC transporter ATP-binding protein [Elusimicrobiota bacterium]|jgi:iron complex transport system ATP-binding protein|nr:ABC transporter ATP-binding protein [Elusimicrobiota bacterium]
MLEAKNVCLAIEGKHLLKDINFKAEEGSFICIAGANGSGKTLMLKTLCGVLQPSAGAVFLNGRDISLYDIRQKSMLMRFLPAVLQSVFNYKVKDIVLMGTNPHIKWWQDYTAQNEAAAYAALQNTDAAHLAERDIFTLSDGEMQRVFIAQILSAQPKAILPDEPTSHLDLKQKNDVFKLFLKAAQNGRIVICATHDIELAKKYATHICLLKNGEIDGFAPAAQIGDADIARVYGL